MGLPPKPDQDPEPAEAEVELPKPVAVKTEQSPEKKTVIAPISVAPEEPVAA